jgi:hypothetical protein
VQATEKSRLSFGKSGIHGWGLIARKTILEGDYVVDYRGTLVRPSVANLREQHYRRIGKDCYVSMCFPLFLLAFKQMFQKIPLSIGVRATIVLWAA